MRLFSSSSASPSERVAVTSIAATWDTIIRMRGLRPCFWKYERDALLQVAGLADVEHLAGGAQHPVHAGQAGQSGDEGLRIEHGFGL